MHEPVPPSIQAAIAELRMDAAAIVDRAVVRMRAEVEHAARGPADELRRDVATLLDGALDALSQLRPASPEDLAAAEAAGRRHALRGGSLLDVLRSHRIGVRESWVAFEELARRRDIDAGDRMRVHEALWQWADPVVAAAVSGHRAAEADAAAGASGGPHPVTRLGTVRLEDRPSFVTADGSSIRELAGIPAGNAVNQSLAEATVPPGASTAEHFHRRSEEIYWFTAGAGRMRLGDEESPVRAGDTVVIPPGMRHKLWNGGPEPLVLLCCCSPPYSDEDTVLLEAP